MNTTNLSALHAVIETSFGKDALTSLKEDRNCNKYRRKQIIYSEGNHPNRLYYIVKGKVKVFKTNDDGKELIVDLLSEGDFLGHIALLEGTIYKDTAEALEETELAVIPKEDFDELIHKNPEVVKKLVQLLAKNVSEKESQLLGLAYNSLRRKVADALLTLYRKYHGKEESYAIDISRENLASVAGTATESLIRTLSDFKSEKLIDIQGGRIVILNVQKLEKMLG
ncbi:MAG TPA: Crp/Fnr family transcriptional regulator [Agriterribacter sp.]|nr:Crp/Fnr family transcriptional regulator [Agriterribacter sp.]